MKLLESIGSLSIEIHLKPFGTAGNTLRLEVRNGRALLKNTQNGEAEITIQEFIEDVALVMVDEVHMAKAEALKTLLTSVLAHIPIRWGLTGTVPKEEFAQV